jgi:hypothetical protein
LRPEDRPFVLSDGACLSASVHLQLGRRNVTCSLFFIRQIVQGFGSLVLENWAFHKHADASPKQLIEVRILNSDFRITNQHYDLALVCFSKGQKTLYNHELVHFTE